jgi:hypothetical protein
MRKRFKWLCCLSSRSARLSFASFCKAACRGKVFPHCSVFAVPLELRNPSRIECYVNFVGCSVTPLATSARSGHVVSHRREMDMSLQL